MHRIYAIAIGFDVLVNALTGGEPYQTLSCRIGLSIKQGGMWSHVPLPAWFINHCKNAVYSRIV